MSESTNPDLTIILGQIADGDDRAKDQLFQIAYDELHRIAANLMRNERSGHTIQPTALVNEASIRFLTSGEFPDQESRGLFFWTMARAMRQVLVDHARKRSAQSRGGDWQRVEVDNMGEFSDLTDADILQLDEALEQLGSLDARQAKIVELRFFGGYSMEEIAKQLSVSLSTIEKEWRFARAWLRKQLTA